MTESLVYHGRTIEDRPCTILGRYCARKASGPISPRPREGRLVQQVDINGTTLTLRAFDEAGVQVGSDVTIAKSTAIYDALQTGADWGLVPGGGNLEFIAPTSLFPSGGRRVRLELSCTLTDGVSQPTGIWDIDVESLEQS